MATTHNLHRTIFLKEHNLKIFETLFVMNPQKNSLPLFQEVEVPKITYPKQL